MLGYLLITLVAILLFVTVLGSSIWLISKTDDASNEGAITVLAIAVLLSTVFVIASYFYAMDQHKVNLREQVTCEGRALC